MGKLTRNTYPLKTETASCKFRFCISRVASISSLDSAAFLQMFPWAYKMVPNCGRRHCRSNAFGSTEVIRRSSLAETLSDPIALTVTWLSSLDKHSLDSRSLSLRWNACQGTALSNVFSCLHFLFKMFGINTSLAQGQPLNFILGYLFHHALSKDDWSSSKLSISGHQLMNS